MSNERQPIDLASFFASGDRRLDEREPVADDELDETRRDIELIVADLDKKLVILEHTRTAVDDAARLLRSWLPFPAARRLHVAVAEAAFDAQVPVGDAVI